MTVVGRRRLSVPQINVYGIVASPHRTGLRRNAVTVVVAADASGARSRQMSVRHRAVGPLAEPRNGPHMTVRGWFSLLLFHGHTPSPYLYRCVKSVITCRKCTSAAMRVVTAQVHNYRVGQKK